MLWPAAATDDGVDVALVFANDSRFSKHYLLGMRFAKVNRKENFNYSHSTKLSVYLLGVYILYYLSLSLSLVSLRGPFSATKSGFPLTILYATMSVRESDQVETAQTNV